MPMPVVNSDQKLAQRDSGKNSKATNATLVCGAITDRPSCPRCLFSLPLPYERTPVALGPQQIQQRDRYMEKMILPLYFYLYCIFWGTFALAIPLSAMP